MGCLFSKEDKGSRYVVGGETEDGNAAPARKPTSSTKPDAKTEPLIAKPKLDPKDFIYVKRTGEKLVKAPGTINGQQFVIDSCEDCEIYILDECDSLMIDDCVRCKIVVGPTTGSIFMRDCSDCTCVFMCRQYRCRDCKDVDTHLHVTTRPIIETSTNMRFGCWDFHYEGLEAQMRSAGISEWQNFWSHIYNFNPDDATWSLMPPDRTAISVLEPLPDVPELEGIAAALADGARPPLCVRTLGERPPPGSTKEGCLILVPACDAHMAREICDMAHAAKVSLVRTNRCQFTEAWATSFLTGGGAAYHPELCKGKAIGLEFGGEGCADAMRGVASSGGFPMLENPDQYAEWRYMGVEG